MRDDFVYRQAQLVSVCLVLLAAASCQQSVTRDASESQLNGMPIVAPVELVTLHVVRPIPVDCSLWRVRGDDRAQVASWPESAEIELRLESGAYYLTAHNADQPSQPGFSVPVPAYKHAMAAADVNATPTITIDLAVPRAPRQGYCWIPAGPALIGDILGVGQPDERPPRVVDVPGFWMAESEVTNLQYSEFLNQQSVVDEDWLDLDSRKCRIKKTEAGYRTDAATLPVVTVTFAGAEAYCAWRTMVENEVVRLPSEWEWEKAARGPESYTYSYGNTYRPEAANQESGQLLPVKSFAPNGFGLYDMTGNAFEWVSGRYEAEPESPQQVFTHVLRGGSFVLDGMYLRNSFRMRQNPAVMTDDFGFRVVHESNPEEYRR